MLSPLFAALAAIGTAAAIGAGVGGAVHEIKNAIEGNWPWEGDVGENFLGTLKASAIGAGTGAVTGGFGYGVDALTSTAAEGTAQAALGSTGQLGNVATDATAQGVSGLTAGSGLQAAQQTGGTLLEGTGGPLQAAVDSASAGGSQLPATTGGTLLSGTTQAASPSLAQYLAQAGLRAGVGGGLGTAQAAAEGRDPLAGFATGAAGAGTAGILGPGLDAAFQNVPGVGIGGRAIIPPGGGFAPDLLTRAGSGFASQATGVPFLPQMPQPPVPQMGVDPYTGMPLPGPYSGQVPYWQRY